MISAPPSSGTAPGAELPGELSALAEQVSRQTRLWPTERRDIRAELESHFSEGLSDLLDAGMTLDQCVTTLRERFGDTAVAAQLIRRAKKRSRPMMYKLIVCAGCVLLAGVASVGGYAAYLVGGQPNPAVDYLSHLNESIQAIPEDQRAWPLLRQAMLQFTPRPEELPRKSAPAPGDAQWSAAMEWVAANTGVVPLLEQAIARPAYGMIYDQNAAQAFIRDLRTARGQPQADSAPVDRGAAADLPPTLSLLLPSLEEHRELAWMLVCDARARFHEGQIADAVERLDLALGLGLLLFDGKTLIEQLVGAAIIRLSLKELREQLYARGGPIDPATLPDLGTLRLMSVDATRLRMDVSGDRLMIHDVIQHVFTDDGAGNGVLIPEQYARITQMFAGSDSDRWSPLMVAAVHADRRTTVATLEAVWAEQTRLRELPLVDPQRKSAPGPVGTMIENPRRFAVLNSMMPSLMRPDEVVRWTRMDLQATRAVMVLLQRPADLPADLQELHPALPPEGPQDIYSTGPLKYHPTAEGDFLLYSVGVDGVDDGGVPGSRYDAAGADSRTPYDEVYWPAAQTEVTRFVHQVSSGVVRRRSRKLMQHAGSLSGPRKGRRPPFRPPRKKR